MYNKLYWTQIQQIQYGVLVFHSCNFLHISSKAHTFEPVFVHKNTHISLYIFAEFELMWTLTRSMASFFVFFFFCCSRLSAFSLYVLLLPLIFLFHLFYTHMHSNRYQITFYHTQTHRAHGLCVYIWNLIYRVFSRFQSRYKLKT